MSASGHQAYIPGVLDSHGDENSVGCSWSPCLELTSLVGAKRKRIMASVDTAKHSKPKAESDRLLVESVTNYAILISPEGIVTTWNAGAQRFKGYRADEIIGQHFSRFYT